MWSFNKYYPMKKYILIILIFTLLVADTQKLFSQITATQMGMYDFKVQQSLTVSEMNGTTDVTTKLQNAVNAARNASQTLFINSGTYKISAQILCLETHNPSITSNNYPNMPVNIVGSALNHPTIVLADNTPAFKGSSPLAIFHYEADPSLPDATDGTTTYDPGWIMEGGIRGINIDLGNGNTNAVGIFWSCAQYCYIEDISINARSGFAGLTGIGGANCLTANISVTGGQYGIYLPNNSQAFTWNMPAANTNTITGCSFTSQSIAAMSLNGWGGITIVGSSIVQTSGTAIIMNGGSYVEAFPLSMIDCSIMFTSQSSSNVVIANAGQCAVSLRGLYVQGAGTICNNNGDGNVANSGTVTNWTHIIRYNYVFKNTKINGYGVNFLAMHYNAGTGTGTGTQSNLDILNAEVVTSVPSNLTSKHIWAITPSFEDSDAVLITATTTAGIQAAINANPKVCLPKGTYSLTSTITLNSNTTLIGCPGRGSCGVILTYGWTPSGSSWLVNTANSSTASTYLLDITTQAGDADYRGSVNWQAGKNSIIRDLWCDREWVTNEPNLIRLYFTNNGGGRVFNYQDEKGTDPSASGSSSLHRKVAVSGTSQPLTFYGLNLERGGGAKAQSTFPMLDISNSSNVFIFGAKSETSQPYTTISNGKNIFITNTNNLTNFGPFTINYINITGNSDSIEVSNSIFYKSPSTSYYVVSDPWNTNGVPRTMALGCYYRKWSSIASGLTNISVTGVTLSPATLSLNTGSTSQLTATVAPTNATNQTVSYSSSNTAVATVSSTGLVTGVAAGTATITVTTADGGFTANCTVTITVASTNLLVNPGFEAALSPYWYSCCSSIAQGTTAHSGTYGFDVTTNGNYGPTQDVASVITLGPGQYYVEAWVKMASGTATVNVQLRATVGSTQYFATPTVTATVGTTWTKLSGTVTLAYTGTPSVVKFYVETPTSTTAYSVDDCVLNSVRSSNISVTGVTLSPATLPLNTGLTSQLTATVAPSNATNQAVSYSSSNTAVATVSATGMVTAVSAGTATITVTTTDGSKTATCVVTVSNILVTGVTLNPATLPLNTGLTSQLTATVAPSNATNPAVSYSSSNTAVATVSSTGLVTGVSAGTATITVTTADGGFTATCAVTVSSVPTNMLINPGFEAALSPYWYTCCSSIAQGTTAHSGTYGCNLTANGNYGPTQNVAGVTPGTYYVEAWVKMASGSATVNVQLRATVGSTNYFATPTATATVGTSWTKISGTVIINYTGTPSVVKFYVETPSSTTSYYVDDCVLNYVSSLTNAINTPIDTVNFNDSDKPVLICFPNPVHDILKIKMSELHENEVAEIYDTKGALIKKENIVDLIQSINVKDLPSGFYFIYFRRLNRSLKFIKD